MALASPAICLNRLCGFSGSWDSSEVRRRSFLYTSADSPLCAGGVRADGQPRKVSDSGLARAVAVRGNLELSDSTIAENGQAGTSVEIPVTCYQIIGVSEKAEKDEVVKAVMELKGSDVEDGYTMDVIQSRQDLLMDVRDKLLFEQDYAGSIKERIPPKASLRIPWRWLPAALCLLLEVGEDKLVIEIGRAALEHQGSKFYAHDLVLSMALAECSIAKNAFEKNQVVQGFEALARSQYFLRSRSSLDNMPLLSQIEESLEELAPACTLELLSMPQTPENGERRGGAISALQELLRQGLEVESSCRVQDWSTFLLQALNRLMAIEIVNLFPWVELSTIRKNKKSLESQNQRIVIDFSCFYMVMIAHIALGFSTGQRELISRAVKICECLVASEGVDLKFEEAFCSLLLSQVMEKAAVEKLCQLQSNNEMKSSNKEAPVKTGACHSVETWLKDSVLGVFPDTRDSSPSLANFFGLQKRILGGINSHKGNVKPKPEMRRMSSNYLSLDSKSLEDASSPLSSPRQMGEAVKQLAPPSIGQCSMNDNPHQHINSHSARQNSSVPVDWWAPQKSPGTIAYMVVLGCVAFSALKVFSMKFRQIRPPSLLNRTCTIGEVVRNSSRIVARPDSLVHKIGEFLKMSKENPTGNKYAESSLYPDIHLRFPLASAAVDGIIHRREMPLEEAEILIRKWQAAKAEALGSSHRVEILSDILSESMLSEWKSLANSAKARSCFWRFVLLKLSILRADILYDGVGGEVAEIEAAIEEAAELVDATQPKNPNYYSSYKILYILKKDHGGCWRFFEGTIQEDSPSL